VTSAEAPGEQPRDDRPLELWPPGFWFNEPSWRRNGEEVLLEAAQGSDMWRSTSYGFTRDTGHAFLTRLEVGSAVEVDVRVDMAALYDQAGVLVRASATSWVKAGVEYFAGQPHLGAVVTDGMSDWSTQPVPEWHGGIATVRVSRGLDSLTVRARPSAGRWQLVRLAPLPTRSPVYAGPYCCAPSRAGYHAVVTRFAVLPGDRSLHCDVPGGDADGGPPTR
jgi:hypothetical protein